MTAFQQGGDAISINSLRAVGEDTIDSIIDESSGVRNAAARLSAEQRAVRQQEASRQLATMIGHNPSVRLQPAAPYNIEEDGDAQENECCVICQLEIDDAVYTESISLLRCKHYFHMVCIDTWQATQLQLGAGAYCPCCRAEIDVEHTFVDSVMFRMHQIDEEAAGEADGEFRTPTLSHTSNISDNSHFSHSNWPVWRHDGSITSQITQLLAHANTQIAGKLSMIVDPGAWISMFGKTIARALTRSAIAAGYKPMQNKLENCIGIAGVGNGANKIQYSFDGPVAIPSEDGTARLFNLSAGIVEEPGEDLPGLLGMDVLRSRRAIMDIGNKRLIFPGEGEIEIRLPPGSFVTPLIEAPSGHMVMVIDAYNDFQQSRGGVYEKIQPLTLPRKNENSSSSSMQALGAEGIPTGSVQQD